jgi:cytochrome c553
MRLLGRLALLAVASAGSALAQAPQSPPAASASAASAKGSDAKGGIHDTIEQRLLACAICHGKSGEGARNKSEYYPRLAGKPVEYLYNQLIGFREKRRSSSPIMTYMVGGLGDNYLHEIASYYSALKPPYPETTPRADAATLARGQELAMRGDKTRDIPACASCHGTGLTGLLPGIPGILGLYPDYLGAQLGAWKDGKRNSVAPDCMARIASRLSGADVSAVSAWLATQPATPDRPPLAAGSLKLPMECGGAPGK